VKTFLEFHDPKFTAPDTAVVAVYEQGIDWSTCGRGGGGFGGDLTVEFRLARTPTGWAIIWRDQLEGSTIIC
jgi:hypothetical protein